MSQKTMKMPKNAARRRNCKSARKAVQERVIEAIAEGKLTAAELARELELSLSELATLAAEPEQSRVLESLAHLADLRAQMLLSHYRANAAVQLIGIASAPEPTELSRKACVDLLNANLHVFADRGENESASAAPQIVDTKKVLDALEALGAEAARA